MGKGADLIDRGFLHSRGFLKIAELVFGAVTCGLMYVGKDNWDHLGKEYRQALTYCFVAPIIMLCITGLIFIMFIFGLTEKLGGRRIWSKLDFYFGCVLGLCMYICVVVLGAIYCGWRKFEYDDHENHLVAGTVFAALATIMYMIETCLLCRECR